MKPFSKRVFLRFILLLLAACISGLSGCGGQSTDRYIPSVQTSRECLEAALKSWKDGNPVGSVKTNGVTVDTFDARWRNKTKLESFEVLSEQDGTPHRTFKVRMRLTGKSADEECTYLVMGIDPILVFRSEDYTKATGQ